MTYLFPDTALSELSELRKNYELLIKAKLSESPQPYKVSRFFGATNFKARDKQIRLIEIMLSALDDKISKNLQFISKAAIIDHIYALRIVKACSLYILATATSGRLRGLVKSALKLSNENKMTKESRGCALLAAQRFINQNTLESINKAAAVEFSESEWKSFSRFINKQCSLLEEKNLNNYPVTAILMPTFGIPLTLLGYGAGDLLGRMGAMASPIIPAQIKIAGALGGGLFWLMGNSGSMGIMFLAPTYASQLLKNFCGVSLAWLLGTTMGLAGKGIGFGVGMSIDIAFKLLYEACSLLAYAYHGHMPLAKLTGFNLINGQRVFEGMEIILECKEEGTNTDTKELENNTEKAEALQQHPFKLEIKPEGLSVTIGDVEELISWNTMNQVDEEKKYYFEELQRIIRARNEALETVEEEELIQESDEETGALGSNASALQSMEY